MAPIPLLRSLGEAYARIVNFARTAARVLLLLGLVSAAGCTPDDTESLPEVSARPSESTSVDPSVSVLPAPTLDPRPAVGSIDGLDYPGLHIGNPRTAWGSVQGGVNMIVFSGTEGAYDATGQYYAIAEVCSRTAVWETKSRRDLEHCFYDKRDRHVYRTTGQDGFLTLLRRNDGARFTFDMRAGTLAADRG
jgi:hypothetical protein